MRTTFDQPGCPTPSAEGNHQGTRGGYDLPDGQKETPGTGGIPNQPTLTTYEGVSQGDVGAGKDITEFQADRTFNK